MGDSPGAEPPWDSVYPRPLIRLYELMLWAATSHRRRAVRSPPQQAWPAGVRPGGGPAGRSPVWWGSHLEALARMDPGPFMSRPPKRLEAPACRPGS